MFDTIKNMGVKSTLAPSNSAPNITKFNLFLKTHEIKQVNQVLQSILLMSKDEREEWILAHGEIVQSAFDAFIDDSNMMLDNMSLDEEAMEMSQELILVLQDSMELVESILSEDQRLTS